MKNLMSLFFAISTLVLMTNVASAQDQPTTQTFVVVRVGTSGGAYHYVEVFQQRGRWIFPDVGYIDFDQAKQYREYFVGAGAVLFSSKHLTVIEEGYLDKAAGPSSGDALYFQPWTLVAFSLTPKLGAEAVYFPYLPLNKAARIQHVLERAKLEYDFKHFKLGGGYGAYQFGDGPWQNKPFVSGTIKVGKMGDVELWLQRSGNGDALIQVRYGKTFKH